MRKIKFRAWDTAVKYLFYPTKIDLTEKMILMQYTGLKDKNGKEIYEGDICKLTGGAQYNGIDEYTQIIEVSICGADLCALENSDCLEILGNVYQTPELLRDKCEK